ncbi:hypothetical protein L3V31_14600 [Vibrio sp. J1-1]|uniref:hypothetical protein n=1 Tax=Vibrio sp. J1-1 TaxID=2912251 RepID=UPI001F44A9EE|nr:hypothetical protein [Vibrio sp. J1-1]MCF7482941.1 hypothetical protein [Vibrio sp. J1-1]
MEIMETIIIFLAFLVALSTLVIQRQHNRKALQPVLNTVFTSSASEHDHVKQELILTNNGNGAAIINKIELHLKNGNKIEISKNHSFEKVLGEKSPSSTKRNTFLPFAIGANSEELLYKYTIRADEKDQLEDCYLTIEAESLYGDKINVHRHGFDVVSNPRDKFIEDIVKSCIDFLKGISTSDRK